MDNAVGENRPAIVVSISERVGKPAFLTAEDKHTELCNSKQTAHIGGKNAVCLDGALVCLFTVCLMKPDQVL